MRPVNKPIPSNEISTDILNRNKKRGWSENRSLQGALADTIGHYCSFCELPINVGEHIEDKRFPRRGQLARFSDWDHLLLSCSYCQNYRRNGEIRYPSLYLWPDIDSSFTLADTSPLIYNYKDVNCVLKNTSNTPEKQIIKKLVIVEANSGSSNYQKAQEFINLFQLNTPAYDVQTNTLTLINHTLGTYPDRRLFLRTEAWDLAQDAINRLTEAQNIQLPQDVVDKLTEAEITQLSLAFRQIASKNTTAIARTYGFWSVWMTAFWQKYKDQNLLKQLFVSTEDRDGFVIHGYQGLPETSQLPPEERRPKRRRITKTYLLFTGTAHSRITYGDTTD